MRIPVSRVLVGAAVTAIALLTAAGTASATTAKTPTHLLIAESAAHITAGHTDIITGALTANGKPLARKAVILARWRHRRWIPVAARSTGKAGAVKFVRRPARSTKFRLEYRGNARFTRTHSSSVSVTVVKIPTALNASESAATIKTGQRDTISGTLTRNTKPLAKRIVWLCRVVAGQRHRLRARLTNARGSVSFRVKPKATTSYELAYFGNRTLAGSVSGTVTVTVKR